MISTDLEGKAMKEANEKTLKKIQNGSSYGKIFIEEFVYAKRKNRYISNGHKKENKR